MSTIIQTKVVSKLLRMRSVPGLLLLLAGHLCWAGSSNSSVAPDTVLYGRASEVTITFPAAGPTATLSLSPGGAKLQSERPMPWPGLALAQDGARVLVTTQSTGLKLLDLSDRTHPRELGGWQSTRAITAAWLQGGFAYLLLDRNQLAVLALDGAGQLSLLVQMPLLAAAHQLYFDSGKLYLEEATAVSILDVSDPAQPRPNGRLALPGGITALAVQGELALVGRGTAGVALYDISQPAQPRWLGSHSRLGEVRGAVIDAQRGLVWNRRGEILLLDLVNPAQPTVIGAYRAAAPVIGARLSHGIARLLTANTLQTVDLSAPVPAYTNETLDFGLGVNFGGERKLFIRDHIAYVADWFSGLHLYDISDPSHIRLLSSLHTPGSAKGVVVHGDYAYIADDDHGLQVADVRDPQAPKLVANLPTNGLAYTPRLVGEVLYLAGHRGGFQIIDVKDPLSPKLLGEYDTPGKAWSMEIAQTEIGATALVADDAAGMLVFDVSNPKLPRQIAAYAPGGAAEDVALRGHLAYVAFYDQGLHVVDISDLAHPRLLGRIATPGNARGVTLHGDYAYVQDWLAGITVVDIRDPNAPRIVGSYDSRGAAWGLQVQGHYAFVGDWWGGFVVLDIAQPEQPRLVDHYHGRGRVEQVALQANRAYVAQGAGGLQIYDTTNPLNPTWMTGVDLNDARAVALTDHVACVAAGKEGVLLVDISNPFEARRSGALALTGKAQAVVTVGEHAYVLTDQALMVVNLANPKAPRIVAQETIRASDLALTGASLLLATAQGMTVLDVTDPAHPQPGARYVTSSGATLVSASGRRVALYEAGKGVHIISQGERKLLHETLLDSLTDLSGLALDGATLYAHVKGEGLRIIDLAAPSEPRLLSSYRLIGDGSRLTVAGDTVYVAGNDVIAAVKRLPTMNVQQVDSARYRFTVPKDLPQGAYDLALSRPDGKLVSLPNGLSVQMPAFSKPKFTMEQFRKALAEQTKNVPQ